jgi:site-specific recombinase XerD
MDKEVDDGPRDLAALTVPLLGALEKTENPFEPYRLLDADGRTVAPVTDYMRELQAAARPATTQRSYGMDLLRWFRFLWAAGVEWDQATRVEARDFCRWLQVADKPVRAHWRTGKPPAGTPGTTSVSVNRVTGKPAPSRRYAPTTIAHCETVCRAFYDYQLEAGSGPMINPFPLVRPGRAHAHHNPMQPFGHQQAGLYRPKQSRRVPRSIPDQLFNELFAALTSHRDRALVALWISTGARASELLGVRCGNLDPGSGLVTVIRKGSRALQPLPASPDAFIWLRLYQQQVHKTAAVGADDPLWWTLRRPLRPLTYHAARAMFARANAALGSNWTLHDLRHTAAYRMARDPLMPLTDVQWVLGHAHLSTTQIYVNSRELHLMGGKPQVARSRRESAGLRGHYELAA